MGVRVQSYLAMHSRRRKVRKQADVMEENVWDSRLSRSRTGRPTFIFKTGPD